MIGASLLRNLELFEEFDEDQFNTIVAGSDERHPVRGDIIFSEGAEAADLYVVTSGRIAISNKFFDGRESMFALMGRGDLFGEMSLFDGLGRSAEARALEPSSIIVIPYRPLQGAWTDRPELLWKVVALLTRRLRAMDEALADSFFLDVTGRTAKHLLEIAGDRDSFEIPITQEELAGLVGAPRERVNKAISSFLRLGWMEQHDRTYVILKRREFEIRAS